MTRHLLLFIRFLDDRYHGLTDNGERPEWPPSPFRVFQALVAGNARGETISPPLAAALRWLESLPPPSINAPKPQSGQVLLTYVLNNTSDTNPNSRAPKTLRPTLLNSDRLVQYDWQFDQTVYGASDHVNAIIQAVRHIQCLGWGIDLAVGSGEVVETIAEVNGSRVQYRPSLIISAGGAGLRTPKAGSLLSLERGYADFIRRYESPGITRLESAGAIYESQQYVTGPNRPNIAFRLIKTDDDDDRPFPRHQLIAPLVGMLRNLANAPSVVASLGQEVVDREIKGHARESTADRVSILPLPTIRHGPTDGRIRRVVLAQPLASSGILCDRLAQLFDGQELTPLDRENRFPRMFLERITHPSSDKVLPLYLGISRVWASVTPVLLPGYDDRKQHRGDHQKRLARAEQLAAKSLAQAGIDIPACIEISRVPYWSGSLHVRDYQPREKLAHYPRWHVRLIFDHCWTGPLTIGAGRHAGFGIMAACSE